MKRTLQWCLVAAGALVPAGLSGQDQDSPGRGVARISVLDGDVSIRRGGEWIAAAVNAPLVAEDAVHTGTGSRAEIQFDYANLVRLAPNTQIRLSQLEHRRYQVQVERGTVTWRVLRDSDAEAEISTPAASARPSRRGAYRVAVAEDGPTEITVRSGELEVFTPNGVERIKAGRTLIVRSSGAGSELQAVDAASSDDWDRWNEGRDRYLERSGSYRYVPRDIYGAEELDDYGHWIYVDRGWAWRPRVGIGWAPYRHGRWTWLDIYGWTWLSYDPWGWAPFHYGRWFHRAPYGWCWDPGRGYGRHHWSPGLVAFFGFGRGGFGHGRVGWVPLAPHEPYYPWYGGRHYGRYPNRYSRDHGAVIINNINIRDRYRNARVRDSISALDDGRFVRGEFSGMLRLSGDQLGEARLVRGNLPWTPGMEARRLSDRGPLVIPRSGREGGRFYSRWQPGGAARNPPEDRRSDFRGQVVAPVGPQDAGWRRFGAQGRSFERPGEAPGGEDSGGWRRFGSPAPDSDRRQREWPRFGSSRGSDGSSVGRSYEGWRRFGDFGGNYPDERFRRQRGFEMGPGESVPGRARRPEALEIAPPVVRERSSRRMEGESGGFGQPGAVFRGGGRSWGGDRSARGDGGTGGSGGRSMERGARGDRGGRDSGYSGRGGRAGGRSR